MNKTILKAFVGLLFLIVVMGIVLFSAVGTLHYRAGWVYLSVFFLCCAAITGYLVKKDMELLKRRLSAGPAGEKEKSQKIIQSIAQLAFIAIYVVAGLDRRCSWSLLPKYLYIIGDAVVLVGFYIVFKTFAVNTFTAANIQVAKAQTVITTGPYAIVRHPMYSGALLLLLGTPVALNSWWALLSVLPMFVVIIARLMDEERFLKKNLSGYTDYCLKVKWRLLPGVF
ncbi:methyltransferase family protein [Taibaiella koreensis]|uniref:methyltransferase family protein n=1 Tax=Taibaiella koreensis TaxID=1268548 RepID=UPI000E59B825|nr:isoprenylcysteine carboxylmethyltransferase family protein [Taibaiella koreensis]